MRPAIVTKWLPSTRIRSARLKAHCDEGSTTVGWDYALSREENHEAAARALCAELGWDWRHRGGVLPRAAPHLAAFFCIDG